MHELGMRVGLAKVMHFKVRVGLAKVMQFKVRVGLAKVMHFKVRMRLAWMCQEKKRIMTVEMGGAGALHLLHTCCYLCSWSC